MLSIAGETLAVYVNGRLDIEVIAISASVGNIQNVTS